MKKGFTLLELIVAVGIMLIAGAVAIPMLLKHLKDAKVANLNEALLNIRTAFNSFYTANEGVLTDTGDPGYIDDMLNDGWLSSNPDDASFDYEVLETNDTPKDYYVKFTPKAGKEAAALDIVKALDEKIDDNDGNAAGSLQWTEGTDNLVEAYYKLYGDTVWH